MELTGGHTTIRWEIAERVATVWLHRPHRHNAWTGTTYTEFRQVMAELEHRTDVRAVVVTGTPPAFCVGGDSKALTGHGERGGYDSGLAADPARPGGGDRLDATSCGSSATASRSSPQSTARAPASGCRWCCSATSASSPPMPSSRRQRPSSASPPSTDRVGCFPVSSASRGQTTSCCRAASSRERRPPTRDCGTAWSPMARRRSPPPSATPGCSPRAPARDAVTITKRQIVDDLLRHDPAASVADSLRLLDDAMGTDEYREGVRALPEKRPPNF